MEMDQRYRTSKAMPVQEGEMVHRRGCRAQRWLLSTVLLVLAAEPGSGQTVLREAEVMREIEGAPIVSMGEEEGQGYVGLVVGVERRHNGEWVVVDQFRPTEVEFFSPSGRWLRALGREGEGPGEFQEAWFLGVLPDDGLLVLDPGLGRITHFDPNLEVIGTTATIPSANYAAFLGSGEVVVSARISSRDKVGLPLHTIDQSGQISASFGADPPIRNWGDPLKTMRRISPSGSGAVWSAGLEEYSVERWTTQGRRTAHFRREVSWFPPPEPGKTHDRIRDPPVPWVYAVHEDDEGLLWVMIHVADENWSDAFVEKMGPLGPTKGVDDWNLYRDSILEVIDPRRGVVIASKRFDPQFFGFTRQGMPYAMVYRDGVFPTVQVWDVKLRPSRGRE